MAANPRSCTITAKNGLIVTAKLHSNNLVCLLEAEEPKLAAKWELRIENSSVPTLTKGVCQRAEHVIEILEASKLGKGVTLSVKKQDQLVTLHFEEEKRAYSDKNTFTLLLGAEDVDQITRVERIATRNATLLEQLLTEKDESFHPDFCHPTLFVSSNNRALVAKGVNQHANATTGVAYSQGQHFWAVRVTRSASNYVFCGVCVESCKGGKLGYCGVGLTGVSFYSNGTFYPGGGAYPCGTAPSGSVVGVLLDMDKKVVQFSVNGLEGVVKPLPQAGPYYFHCSVYTQFDAVELLPELCWHK